MRDLPELIIQFLGHMNDGLFVIKSNARENNRDEQQMVFNFFHQLASQFMMFASRMTSDPKERKKIINSIVSTSKEDGKAYDNFIKAVGDGNYVIPINRTLQ